MFFNQSDTRLEIVLLSGFCFSFIYSFMFILMSFVGLSRLFVSLWSCFYIAYRTCRCIAPYLCRIRRTIEF